MKNIQLIANAILDREAEELSAIQPAMLMCLRFASTVRSYGTPSNMISNESRFERFAAVWIKLGFGF